RSAANLTHRVAQHVGLSDVEAVAGDHDERLPSEKSIPEPAQKIAEALADGGAAAPRMLKTIDADRVSRSRAPHFVGDAAQPRRERERLYAHRRSGNRDGELERGRCGVAHRAAAVDEHDEPRRAVRTPQPPATPPV